jgi:hypothetical protein
MEIEKVEVIDNKITSILSRTRLITAIQFTALLAIAVFAPI